MEDEAADPPAPGYGDSIGVSDDDRRAHAVARSAQPRVDAMPVGAVAISTARASAR
jgi:hypothetical protein